MIKETSPHCSLRDTQRWALDRVRLELMALTERVDHARYATKFAEPLAGEQASDKTSEETER